MKSHVHVPVKVTHRKIKVETQALVDCGASTVFVHDRFVKKNRIPKKKLKEPIVLYNIDRSKNQLGSITHFVKMEMDIDDHKHPQYMAVTNVGNEDIVIGVDWMKTHNPNIDWTKGLLALDRCQADHTHPKSALVSSLPKQKRTISVEDTVDEYDMQIDLNNINWSYVPNEVKIAAGFSKSQELAQAQKPVTPKTLEEMIPIQYREYLDVFSKKKASRLPKHQPWDFEVKLKPGYKMPPKRKQYRLSPVETKALDEHWEEQEKNGYSRVSLSPFGAPSFFVPKKEPGALRLVANYKDLNDITEDNRYPIPLSNEIIDMMQDAEDFSELDILVGFNNIRVKEGDEWKLAYSTNRGLREPLVMPMGVKGAPGTFQKMMNFILVDLINRRVVIAYLDNIWIFTKGGIEVHRRTVKEVLQILKDNDLYCKPEKCKFEQKKIEVLGLIVSPGQVEMDPIKLRGVLDWPEPKKVVELQSFTGFANFYRRFIPDFSEVSQPLYRLTKKDVPWTWGEAEQEAFDELKSRFCQAPILKFPDTNLPFKLETDASNYATGAILSQIGEDGEMHPVAYHSKSMAPAERNYEIHDKELLAIIRALKEYRQYLEGQNHVVDIFTDHKNLEYFMGSQDLSRRQARWALFLSRFNFRLHHRPGKLSAKPDALSRRPDHFKEDNDDNKAQIMLKPEMIVKATDTEPKPILERIRQHSGKDAVLAKALQQIKQAGLSSLNKDVQEWQTENGIVLHQGKVYVPQDHDLRRDLVSLHHDTPLTGHMGRWKTYELLSRNYWWPGMSNFVEKYVDGCETCGRNKTFPHKPFGLLQPNEVPTRPWGIISCDFITHLPPSRQFNAIMVVVDRMTKMAHFIPTTDDIDAAHTAKLYMQRVWRTHGVPDGIISDRGPQFDSLFMKELLHALKCQPRLSTPYHPRTDGQTERVNQNLEQYIRIFCNYEQNDWAEHLAHAEFTYNNSAHSATKVSPFYANYGFNPVFEPTVTPEFKSPSAQELLENIKRVQKEARSALVIAAERMKRHFDRRVQELPKIPIGSKVYISAKNIRTTRPAKKFAAKWHGPFRVIRKIGLDNYQIELPSEWKIHNVFHSSLLRPSKPDQIAGRRQQTIVQPQILPPILAEEDPDGYLVEEVIRSRRNQKGSIEYQVKWKGYKTPSWMPATTLTKIDPIFIDYHKKNPDAPRPQVLKGTQTKNIKADRKPTLSKHLSKASHVVARTQRNAKHTQSKGEGTQSRDPYGTRQHSALRENERAAKLVHSGQDRGRQNNRRPLSTARRAEDTRNPTGITSQVRQTGHRCHKTPPSSSARRTTTRQSRRNSSQDRARTQRTRDRQNGGSTPRRAQTSQESTRRQNKRAHHRL